MKRRHFLSKALTAGAGGLATPMLATQAAAQGIESFTLLTDRPERGAAFAARVAAITGGRITISVTDAPADVAMFDRVAAGQADLCLAPCDAFLDRAPALGLFAAMPFGMSSTEVEAWVMASDGQEMWDAIAGDFGLRFSLAGDEGTAPLWSKAALGDVAGLQVGALGLSAQSFDVLGAQVLDLRSSEIARGALDMIEGLSPAQMVAAGLAEAFPNVSLANPNRPSGLVALGMNAARMSALSEGDRFAIERTAKAHHAGMRTARYHEDALALASLGATASPLPDALWSGMREAAEEVLNTVFESGPKAAAAVDAYIYFLAEVSIWSDIGEAAYYAGRKQVAAL
ncbi:MAG: hypothetical protein AAF646_03730 [Pseudomonadota bacterium]